MIDELPSRRPDVVCLRKLLCAGEIDQETQNDHVISRGIHLKRTGYGKRIIPGKIERNDRESEKPDLSLLKVIAHARIWFDDLKAGLSYKEIAKKTGIDQRHIARTIRLAFLAPEIVEAIFWGKEPEGLTAE